MKIKILAILAAILLTSVVTAQESGSWSWNKEENKAVEIKPQAERRSDENVNENDQKPSPAETSESQGRHLYSDQEIYSNDTSSADDVVDYILDSSRQGRNLEGYDEFYADPIIQEALQRGDDSEARNLILDKLCDLGLTSCNKVKVKIPPPPGFHQGGPRGPYGPPRPLPPPGKFGPGPGINTFGPPPSKFGPPPSKYGHPPPPGPPGKYGPPRKVGFEGPSNKPFLGPVYPGPSFENTDYEFTKPPPGAIIYGSKPPGGISGAEPPYEFDSFSEKIHHQGSFEQHSGGHFGPGKPSIVLNPQGGAANAAAASAGVAPLQQHVHHHFHHVEGDKIPNVPVPLAVGNGIGGDFASISGSSGFDLKNQQSASFAGGFDAASSASSLSSGFHGVNSGQGSNGLYTSIRPVVESGFNPSINPGLGQYGTGGSVNGVSFGQSSSSGFNNGGGFSQSGSSGFNGGFGGNSDFGSNGGFGSNAGFGGNSGGSFHSSNPGYFSKDLNVNGGAASNGLQGYGSQFNGQYSKYSNGESYQGFETARQGSFDCICVPYQQCPAADRIGRKDDLILPLDPRNLGKDIQAVSDEPAGNSTSIDSEKSATEHKPEEAESKKKTKRDVQEAKEKVSEDAIDNAADAEGRINIPLPDYEFGKRKVLPTFGVSFGLPHPSGAYPFNPFGGPPAQNPYFGSIGPNGLNLGLLNVNPLVSLQVTKSEYGEKLVKPLVNFHVTPNEHIIHKVGQLFHAKKEHLFNKHEHIHHHSHHAYPPPPEVYHPEHVYPHPPSHHHHQHGYPSAGPEFYPEEIPSYESGTYGFAGPYYRDGREFGSDTNSVESGYNQLYPEYNTDEYYKRSSNVSGGFSFPPSAYAGQYDYDSQERQEKNIAMNQYLASLTRPVPAQAPGHAAGGKNVAFPNSRRKRSPELNEEKEEVVISKRQAYYGARPQQQCRADQVCCRRPVQSLPQQQFGRCGVRSAHGVTGRIKNPSYVDGDSEFGEYPWQAAILKKDPKESVYVCGGTIIDAQHIITAAHCIKTYSGFDLRVRLGEWDVNHDVEFFPYVERDVISVIIHPEYYAGTLDNDLAVIRLDRPIDFTKSPHISPACLPDKFSDFSGHRCWTTGWGKDAFGSFGKYQNILKEVDVPVLSNQQCQAQLRQTRLGYNYVLNPGFICAGGEEGKDACKGDGGGPMVCERNGIWQVVGVVSWGIGCGQVNVPGVYVRVAHYLDWINQITRNY